MNGLIVVFTGRESIKLAPPLSIHLSALKEGLSVFEDLFRKYFKYKPMNYLKVAYDENKKPLQNTQMI